SCRPRATDEGTLEPMNVWDRYSRANATSSVGRCRHIPLQGKAIHIQRSEPEQASRFPTTSFRVTSPLSTLHSSLCGVAAPKNLFISV
ncbi:MAG: hypothetical protein ACI4RP_04070, partial [Acutalibacteraceae bacterium]